MTSSNGLVGRAGGVVPQHSTADGMYTLADLRKAMRNAERAAPEAQSQHYYAIAWHLLHVTHSVVQGSDPQQVSRNMDRLAGTLSALRALDRPELTRAINDAKQIIDRGPQITAAVTAQTAPPPPAPGFVVQPDPADYGGFLTREPDFENRQNAQNVHNAAFTQAPEAQSVGLRRSPARREAPSKRTGQRKLGQRERAQRPEDDSRLADIPASLRPGVAPGPSSPEAPARKRGGFKQPDAPRRAQQVRFNSQPEYVPDVPEHLTAPVDVPKRDAHHNASGAQKPRVQERKPVPARTAEPTPAVADVQADKPARNIFDVIEEEQAAAAAQADKPPRTLFNVIEDVQAAAAAAAAAVPTAAAAVPAAAAQQRRALLARFKDTALGQAVMARRDKFGAFFERSSDNAVGVKANLPTRERKGAEDLPTWTRHKISAASVSDLRLPKIVNHTGREVDMKFAYLKTTEGGLLLSNAMHTGGFGAVHYAIRVGGENDGEIVTVKKHRMQAKTDRSGGEVRAKTKVTSRRMFENETAVWKALGTHELGAFGKKAYTVFPLGRDVDSVRHHPAAGEDRRQFVLSVLGQAAESFGKIHDANYIHFDIKPDNLLADKYGHVAATDMGLARPMGKNKQIITGDRFGTPGYVAPEMMMGKPLSAKTDTWSLGATFADLHVNVEEGPLVSYSPGHYARYEAWHAKNRVNGKFDANKIKAPGERGETPFDTYFYKVRQSAGIEATSYMLNSMLHPEADARDDMKGVKAFADKHVADIDSAEGAPLRALWRDIEQQDENRTKTLTGLYAMSDAIVSGRFKIPRT